MKHSSLIVTAVLVGFVAGASAGVSAAKILGSSIFPDVRVNTFYDEAVGEMYSEGIITGYEDGTFGPNDYVTRGQVAVLMKRLRDELTGTVSVDDSSDNDTTQSTTATTTTSTSTSNDEGVVRFSIASVSANEDTDTKTISVLRTGGNKGVVTIDYALSSGTATVGQDFEALQGTLSFADGESSKTFTVKIYDDDAVEGSETIIMTLSDPTGGLEMGSPSVATLSIVDNDSSSSSSTDSTNLIRFGATAFMASEDQGSIVITVERTSSGSTQTIQYSTDAGSATSQQYNPVNGTLTFGSSDSIKTFTVDLVNNNEIDGNSYFYVSLSNPSGGATIDGESRVKVTIDDDETGSIAFGTGSFRFTKSVYEGYENDKEVVISLQRVNGTRGTVDVQFQTEGGTAHSNIDYTPVSGTLRFRPGEETKTFRVELVDDAENDQGEEINLRVLNPTNGATLSNPSTARIEIY